MKVVKPLKVPILSRTIELQRQSFFHTAAMLGFPIGSPRALLDELSFWQATASALGDRGVVDEGCAKVRGEVLVAGSFHAPGGAPIPASYVRVKLGSIDKRLALIGDRTWRGDVPTAPEPMAAMPIDWSRAFGGAGHDKNPHGKGIHPVEIDGRAVHPLPNVERYGALIRAPSERPEPAGFLPMDVTFASRRRRAGTYDRRWFEEHFPGMPLDADPAFFNVGPEDQWIDGAFRGDEEFLIENMHPTEPRLEGRLPGLVVRAFATRRAPDGERFLEIPMRLDTVWLFPGAALGVVIFHGVLAVAEDDAADIVHLVCACEDPASPRPLEHYRGVLTRRLDRDEGAVAQISDSDLMPPLDSGVRPNIESPDVARWVRSENLTAQNMRRGQERTFAEQRARLEAEGLDPNAYGLAELPAFPEPPPLDDLDAVAAHMDAQLIESEALVKRGKEAEERAREEARKLWAERGESYDTMAEQAADDSAGPPKFSAKAHLEMLRAMAADARQSGIVLTDLEQMLDDPEYRAQVEVQERGIRDMYRRMGHLQPTAARAMDPEASERARIMVELAIETGERLADRDFTGACLAGMRLAGVDLSGAFLESADLSGCDLSGSNLERAVLARASLRGANLTGARLAGANLGATDLRDAVLERANLQEAVLSRAELGGARFARADLSLADWSETNLAAVDLSETTLGQANLLKLDLRGVRLAGADLSEATLVECKLDGADLSRATLRKATFVGCTGARASFREARFQGGIMVHGCSFPDADFSGADMEKANLRGTVLKGARFDRASVRGADLSECDASGASLARAVLKAGMLVRTQLVNASLRGANLMDALASKARLAGADFTGANLFRADLSRVVGDARTTFAEAEVGQVRFLPKAEVPPQEDR